MIKKLSGVLEKRGRILKRFLNIKPKRKKTDTDPHHPGRDFKLRQRCLSSNKTDFETQHAPMYPKSRVDAEPGVSVVFSFTPRSYLKSLSSDYIETLLMPPEIVASESILEAYSHLCSRIYEHDQAQDLFTESWEQETDICLWLKPYEEPIVERDMNGVLRRKLRKPTQKVNRLRRRTLLVKWMLENSDWQEQLVLHYWNLPRKGTGGKVMLPWFTLEVEYRKGARRRLYRDHYWSFSLIGVTLQMFSSCLEESGDTAVEALEPSVGGASAEAGRGAGGAGADNRRYILGAPQILVEDGVSLAIDALVASNQAGLIDNEASVSQGDILDTTCRDLPKFEEHIGSKKTLPRDGILARPGKVLAKSTEVKTLVSDASAAQAGETQQQAVGLGAGEIRGLGVGGRVFLVAT